MWREGAIMTVEELASGAPSQPAYEKTPPQDVAAEQCVLGGMMLSKDAIADVVEILRVNDFYRPAHATIFDAIIDLYGRGEPADAITVAAALDTSGDLARVGGGPYLHTLISTVPTAANASYYARIVSERAVLRRLVEAGTKIVQLGYGVGGGRDVDDLVDMAQQAVYDVTERRVSEDFAVLADLLQPTLDEIEAVGAQGGLMSGVPTGFTDLDRLLNGLQPGQLIVVAGRPGLGKALALGTPLATPEGWTTMGSVRVGDRLLGADGHPTTVVAATEVLHDRPCYAVHFDDGTVIVADGSHQWPTTSAGVRTTDRLRPFDDAVPNTACLQFPERDLPTPPYVLGVRLVGGEIADPEVAWRVEDAGGYDSDPVLATSCSICGGSATGAGTGFGQCHIPPEYLRASEAQRRALLSGLLDGGGWVRGDGTVILTVPGEGLARDVAELVGSLGYGHHVEARTVSFRTIDEIFSVASKRLRHKEAAREMSLAGLTSRRVTGVRRVQSVPVRCVEVDNASHLYLAGRAMIPTHNSTVSMDFARHAAVRFNLASAIFSLEMSKVEIVMRLLSAEARVPLHVLRSGQLSDDDWTKLARRMGEISEAPIFVDDTPNMTLMEIRAKARRLRQRHDLRLIVVDYLQLMTSPKRVESRQQEVADLSRGLKLLAKEVECPVIAVSQLNRGPEQRTDKRPQLSDLRESGCLTAATRVIRADTNAEVTLGDLLAKGERDIPVWALNERLQYTPRTMTHVFPSGTREVFRMRLASGKHIDATANHPFLAFDGWTALEDLPPGSRIAVPRHVPAPLSTRPWAEAEIVMLAHLLGDGSFVARQPIRYASRDEENLAAVTRAAKHWDISAVRDDYAAARVTTLRLSAPFKLARGRRNPIAAWLDRLGLFGKRSHEKFLPREVFALPKAQITLLLHHLWATDGSVTANKSGRGGRIHLPSTSRRLLEDVSRLLLRYGISARLREVPQTKYRAQYTLDVSGRDDQLRFLREIGVHGERAARCEELLAILETTRSNPNVDTVPREVWGRVREILADQSTSHRQTHTVREPRLPRIAAVLDSAELELLATNDVLWDEIISIESIGEQPTFDATVMGTHNFIADGIAVKNSIEQDADVVILLHRDDYYDKESPRAGEADFIVAKHRNGPTDTITVAAQLHLSRFVDMAIG
jgi:replicative DNA helicase